MSKVILITGVSSGIGKACAEYLSGKYDKVYGTTRREPGGTEKYKVMQMDVRDPEAVQRVIKTIVEKEGRIDVLVNNAGIGHGGAIENYSEEEMNQEISVNFFGKVRMIKAVLPYMRSQHNGLIINVSSIGGLMGLPFQGFYSASKFAIEGLSESLRLELKPFGINVVQINPGDFKTGFTINRVIIDAEKRPNPYSDQFQSTLKKIEKDETGGNDPIIIAKKIDSIIGMKKPGFHYVVGRLDQQLSVLLKRLLPARLFFWILADYYKIK
jgi:NAD(P)-dependent dehydrogenase (short-subunit alcohol dehydrogenase family)